MTPAQRPPHFVPLLVIGICHIVLSVAVGLLWFLLGVGVAMCTDGGDLAGCHRVGIAYVVVGAGLAANVVGGIGLIVAAGLQPRSTGRRLAIGFAVLVFVAVLAFIGILAWTLSGLKN